MSAVLLRAAAGGRRAGAVVERNVVVAHRTKWLMLLSGVTEPVLYLLSIGVGVGALIGEIDVPGAGRISYVEFVAPAMLAVSAMNGAVAETLYNFFGKLKYQKTYDAVLATPVRPAELALGELAWATVRGLMYSAVFLALMVFMGVTSPWRAAVALPATVLVGLAFGGIGMATATVIRGWQDFDLTVTAQTALFLFSATFVPVARYPEALQWLVGLSPLTHGVALLRGITLGGASGAEMALATVVLVAVTVASFGVGARRMRRSLIR